MAEPVARRGGGMPEQDASRVRLFAAVDLPDHVTAAVLAALPALKRAHRGLRWTDPAGWHLTLAFLGWVPAERLEPIRDALAQAAARVGPFPLALTGVAGSFRSGALWAELAEQPALHRLHAAVNDALDGVVPLPEKDRPFRPHLTLARAPGRAAHEAREAAARYQGPLLAWTVERLVLMRSHLRKTGARYETVGTWPLSAASRAADAEDA